eukprot:5756204-Pleurochrysis_carterae.AAC.1
MGMGSLARQPHWQEQVNARARAGLSPRSPMPGLPRRNAFPPSPCVQEVRRCDGRTRPCTASRRSLGWPSDAARMQSTPSPRAICGSYPTVATRAPCFRVQHHHSECCATASLFGERATDLTSDADNGTDHYKSHVTGHITRVVIDFIKYCAAAMLLVILA